MAAAAINIPADVPAVSADEAAEFQQFVIRGARQRRIARVRCGPPKRRSKKFRRSDLDDLDEAEDFRAGWTSRGAAHDSKRTQA